MKYIFTPYDAALDAGIITNTTTRRLNDDQTKVILCETDLIDYKPLIEVSLVVSDREGNNTTVIDKRFAKTVQEKAKVLGAIVMTADEARDEVKKPEWNLNNIE